jgi:hypothetical protein
VSVILLSGSSAIRSRSARSLAQSARRNGTNCYGLKKPHRPVHSQGSDYPAVNEQGARGCTFENRVGPLRLSGGRI